MMDEVDRQIVGLILLGSVKEALALLKKKQYDRAEWLLEYSLSQVEEVCDEA